jgi:thiosulfate dehydrogenase
MLRGFLVGIVFAIVAMVLIGYAAVRAGIMPANADDRPSRFERWVANMSLRASVARGAPRAPNPLSASPSNLTAGFHLYAQNCAVCHGAAKGTPRTRIARGLYQHPPQFAERGVADDPAGGVYWKVRHGIRLTGMPAFSKTLDDTQLWQVTLFVQSIDKLPPAVDKDWKRLKV